METKTESKEPKEIEPVTEWEKPTVTEFDVSSTTLAGGSVSSSDALAAYS